MGDIDLSTFDSVSALDLRYGEVSREVPYRYDLVGTSEYVVVDTFIPLEIFESVSVSESYETWGGTLQTYQGVTVTEYVSATTESFISEDPRTDYQMRMPVWKLTASFAPAFITSGDLQLPAYSGLGYFGARLSERIPTWSLSASMLVNDVGMSLSRRIPVWSGYGRFGGRLNERIPVRTISASFAFADTFRLDARLPTWRLSASFLYPNSFTLSQQIPIWTGTGELVLSEISDAYLDERIPGAFIFSGSMYEEGSFSLDERMPVWRLESSMYSSDFHLDATIPVWIMQDNTDGYLREVNRFSDYVLRYVRP